MSSRRARVFGPSAVLGLGLLLALGRAAPAQVTPPDSTSPVAPVLPGLPGAPQPAAPCFPDCNPPPNIAPDVIIEPWGGTYYSSSPVSVTVFWCDDAGLNGASRQIKLGTTDVTSSFTYTTAVNPPVECVGNDKRQSQGTITLGQGANSLSGKICDTGGLCTTEFATFTYDPTPPPNVVTTPTNGDYRNTALCVADCFEKVITYSTPAYISMDQPRSATLVYRSLSARTRASVFLDVSIPTGAPVPDKFSVKLQREDGTWVTFGNGQQEMFFTAGTDVYRLAVEFSAGGLATGAHFYTAVVRSWYKFQSAETTKPVRILIVNEKNNPIARGWTLAGLQRVHVQADSFVTITEGDGSIAYFKKFGSTFVTPPGDFSTLTQLANGRYERRYPGGTTVKFTSTGLQDSVVDRVGNFTEYVYDTPSNPDRLKEIVDPAGGKIKFTYNSSRIGSIQTQTSTYRTTSFVADAGRRITDITDPDGVKALQITYVSNLATSVTDRSGARWGINYDGFGRLRQDSLPQIVADGQTVRPLIIRWSPESIVLPTITSGKGTSSNPAPAVAASDAKPFVKDARGNSTFFLLDRFGAPTRIEEPLGRTAELTRNSNSQVTRVVTPSADTLDLSWSGPRLTFQRDRHTGQTVNYAHELTYNQVTHVWGDVRESWFFYDAANGQLDSLRAGLATDPVTTFTYDSVGRVKTVTLPGNNVTTNYYASAGFPGLSNTDSVTFANRRIAALLRDSFGRVVQSINARDDTVATDYDDVNRTLRSINPAGDTTTLVYDSLYVRKVIDPKGQVYETVRNAAGWVTAQIDPRGKLDSLRYDKNGNVTGVTDRLGNVFTLTYDALNQLTSRVVGSDTTLYATDPGGLFAAVQNSVSIDTVVFDPAGRLQSSIARRGTKRWAFDYTYNIEGLRTSVKTTSPWVREIKYGYDVSMRLDTLTDMFGGKTTIAYNANGQPVTLRLPTADTIGRDYSALQSVQNSHSDTLIDRAIGERWDLDELLRVGEVHSNAAEDTARTFTYDDLGRLTAYADSTSSEQPSCTNVPNFGYVCGLPNPTQVRQATYAYDEVGNRTDSGATIQTGNRLTAFGGFTLEYDDAGNLTRKFNGSGFDQRFYWNALGQLDSVTTAGSPTVRYEYDGFGRRVKRLESGSDRQFVYDGNDLFFEVSANGASLLAEYNYYPGVDRPHSVRRGGSIYYYATNHAGSVVGLFDASSAVNKYRYSPYGEDQGTVEAVTNPLRFNAREFDAVTGLYYFRSRYYDPSVSRFISEDPIGLAGGLNPYAFVSGDPVNLRDPFGLDPCGPGPKGKPLSCQPDIEVVGDDPLPPPRGLFGGGSIAGDRDEAEESFRDDEAEMFEATKSECPRFAVYRPVPGPITSGFSLARRDPFTGKSHPHQALDFRAPLGTPIKSFGPGVVNQVGYNSTAGNLVKVSHAEGYESSYSHASEILVAPGQKVHGGQTLGLAGATGRATGPHLHFVLRKDNVRVDPTRCIPQ